MNKTFYDHIDSNKRQTYLLIFLFIALIGLISFLIGLVYDSVWISVILGLVVGTIYFLIAYYQGKNIILKVTGAFPANKKEHKKLLNIVEEVSISAGLPTPEVYLINDTALNAFATGTSPKKSSITVTTGLLNVMNREELEGVIAHELSHIGNNDIRYLLLVSVLVGVLIMLSDFLLRSFIWGGRGRNNRNSNGGVFLIIIGLVLAIITPIIAHMIKLSISRKREFLADATGVKITRNPNGLAKALKKISQDPDPLVDRANRGVSHLFISNPFKKEKKKKTNLFSTHPSLTERITRIKKM